MPKKFDEEKLRKWGCCNDLVRAIDIDNHILIKHMKQVDSL